MIYEDFDLKLKNELIAIAPEAVPYWKLLGMQLIDIKKGWAKVALPITEKLKNGFGVVHGGALFSPADSAVGTALLGLVENDTTMATIEMKINYIKPIREGTIIVEARIIHMGRTIALGEADICDNAGNLLGKVLTTYKIMKNHNND